MWSETFIEWLLAIILALTGAADIGAPEVSPEPTTGTTMPVNKPEHVEEATKHQSEPVTEVLSMNVIQTFSADLQAASFPNHFHLETEADWWLQGGRWVDLVREHFGDLGENHMNIATCVVYGESRGTPGITNSIGARGLFQIMPNWANNAWAGTSGISYADLLNPEDNVFVARKVWDKQGWGAWSAYGRDYIQDCIAKRPFTNGWNWLLQDPHSPECTSC